MAGSISELGAHYMEGKWPFGIGGTSETQIGCPLMSDARNPL